MEVRDWVGRVDGRNGRRRDRLEGLDEYHMEELWMEREGESVRGEMKG